MHQARNPTRSASSGEIGSAWTVVLLPPKIAVENAGDDRGVTSPQAWVGLSAPAGIQTVGREHEIEDVPRLLTTTRLLTLTGPGGVGKTRLSQRVAADLGPSFPDGIWLVELAGLGDASLLTQVVASALGIREQPGRALHDLDELVGRAEVVVKPAPHGIPGTEHITGVTILADGAVALVPDLSLLVRRSHMGVD